VATAYFPGLRVAARLSMTAERAKKRAFPKLGKVLSPRNSGSADVIPSRDAQMDQDKDGDTDSTSQLLSHCSCTVAKQRMVSRKDNRSSYSDIYVHKATTFICAAYMYGVLC
jgi:hypothetical protein